MEAPPARCRHNTKRVSRRLTSGKSHSCGAWALHDASATQENTLHDQQDDSILTHSLTHSLTLRLPIRRSGALQQTPHQAVGWEGCALASKGCSAEPMRGACGGEATCNGVPKTEQVQKRLHGESVYMLLTSRGGKGGPKARPIRRHLAMFISKHAQEISLYVLISRS